MAIGWNNDELVVGFGIEKEEVCDGADKSIPVDERSGNSGPNSKNQNIGLLLSTFAYLIKGNNLV